MTTRKRKKFTGNNIPNTLTMYDTKYSDIDNAKHLSCFLANNKIIKEFALSIFYFVLSYWKNHTHANWSSIIEKSMIESIHENIIYKIGFSHDEYKEIVNLVNKNQKIECFDYLQDKFFKVTACLNNLAEPVYTVYHVEFNKNLQKKIIKGLEHLMLIQNITWKDIKVIYDSLKHERDINQYNFFIFDIIYSTDDNVDSIYRKNLGNMIFFREKLTELVHNKNNYIKINKCNQSTVSDKNYSDYGIYNSTERYKISGNNPYAKLMHKFDEPFLAGPSGSTSVMYISLFQFYNYPFTYKNKILLLGLVIADYVPLWHTIPEILLSAYPEWKDPTIQKYTLNMNSVIYSTNLLKPFFIN